MLSTAGRRARTGATAAVALLLLLGTAVGGDDAFPFGPFRMYSTRDAPNGSVLATRVEAVDSSGRVLVVPDTATGLRRAEIEGQADRFRREPALLAALSRAHDRLRPGEPRYEQVRVVERRYELRDSRPTGLQTERVVASWTR